MISMDNLSETTQVMLFTAFIIIAFLVMVGVRNRREKKSERKHTVGLTVSGTPKSRRYKTADYDAAIAMTNVRDNPIDFSSDGGGSCSGPNDSGGSYD